MVVNLSSRGILVASEREVTEGALVEMRIEWPSLLHGRVPLQLVVVGRVLRRDASQFAATFERYQFRTMKSSGVSPIRRPKSYWGFFLENFLLTSGQNSFRTFDAISTPICMPSFVVELLALRLS